jgi:hypothetical protein
MTEPRKTLMLCQTVQKVIVLLAAYLEPVGSAIVMTHIWTSTNRGFVVQLMTAAAPVYAFQKQPTIRLNSTL